MQIPPPSYSLWTCFGNLKAVKTGEEPGCAISRRRTRIDMRLVCLIFYLRRIGLKISFLEVRW